MVLAHVADRALFRECPSTHTCERDDPSADLEVVHPHPEVIAGCTGEHISGDHHNAYLATGFAMLTQNAAQGACQHRVVGPHDWRRRRWDQWIPGHLHQAGERNKDSNRAVRAGALTGSHNHMAVDALLRLQDTDDSLAVVTLDPHDMPVPRAQAISQRQARLVGHTDTSRVVADFTGDLPLDTSHIVVREWPRGHPTMLHRFRRSAFPALAPVDDTPVVFECVGTRALPQATVVHRWTTAD